MSAKRQATSDLNHNNWDREEEPEERGTFQTAPEDELKGRVIKKARRKIAGSTATDVADGSSTTTTTNKSVFSGFAGFGKPSTSSGSVAATSPFSFLAKIAATAATSSTTSAVATATSASITTNKPTFSFGRNAAKVDSEAIKLDSKQPTKPSDDEKSTSYYAKLKGLNQAVSDWIKTHVDKNPLCILTPIFKDYENYLNDIEKEDKKNAASLVEGPRSSSSTKSPDYQSTTFGNFKFSSSYTTTNATASTTPAAASFSFGIAAAKTEPTASSSIFGGAKKTAAGSNETPKSNGFSFGLKSNDKTAVPPATSGFSFGKPTSTTADVSSDKNAPATTGFSFTAGAAPFSFGNIQPPVLLPTSTANAEEDDEDQPPKVEFKQVVEDDAVFSKKCKVFVKKDGNFADRGVGTLYLKPVKDSEKTQLLVRADTNLGNILVNLILSAAIPAQRMGKNNVMLVCLPTPEVEKPTSMLIRVKTSEEADELLETIEKHKK